MAFISIFFDVYFELTEEKDILKFAEGHSQNFFIISIMILVSYFIIRIIPEYTQLIAKEKESSKKFSKKFTFNYITHAVGDSTALFYDLWSI